MSYGNNDRKDDGPQGAQFGYDDDYYSSARVNMQDREEQTRALRRKTFLKVLDSYSNDVDRTDQPGNFRDDNYMTRRNSLGSIASGNSRGPLIRPPKKNDIATKVLSFFPVVDVVRNYSRPLLIGDLRAGLTVGIVLVLRSIVFAQLAQVSVIVSLVSSIIPIAVYGILGTSKQLSVGPEALAAVLIGASVTEEIRISGGGNPDQIAAAIAMMVGLFALLLSVMRAGFLDSILTGFMKTGFISSVGLLIMIEQLPELIGIDLTQKPSPEFSSFNKMLTTSGAAMRTGHVLSTIIGIVAVVFMVAMRFVKAKTSIGWLKAFPEIVVLVLVMIGISAAVDLKGKGVRTLGTFNNKLIPPAFPPLSGDRISRLAAGAVIQTIVGFVESMAVSKDLGMQYGYNPKPNRELFALGMANVIGSIFGCFVTMGSLPRSKILADSGGRTNVCSLFAAGFVTIFVFTAGPLLQFLPLATLAGFVLAAAMSLVHVHEILFVIKCRSFGEIIGMVAAFAATFFWNIEESTIVVLFLASILIIRRSVGVDMQLLGQVNVASAAQNTKTGQMDQTVLQSKYLDVRDHPEAELLDDILIISVRSSLLFFNSGNISVTLDKLLKAQRSIAEASGYAVPDMNRQIIIINMDGCAAVDAGAVFLIYEIIHTMSQKGVKFILSGILPEQKTLFVRAGILDQIGEKNNVPTLDMAVLRAQTIKSNGGLGGVEF
ncbi:sulfate transporter family-domain-containing protein [Phlyctochytrium arcticum]|nr:sulfate transporter family-domain-containing protein [Phlyctochytrium arcticum]